MEDKTNLHYSRTHLLEVDSTNRYIRENAMRLWEVAPLANALVVTTDVQTAGRGQKGAVWHSATKENILLSILVRPSFLPVVKQFALSQAVALSLHDTLACYNIDVLLKWPNDIYSGGRKIAGTLIELDYSGASVEQAIIGIGLNVNQRLFCPMERKPVSMALLADCRFSLEEVTNTMLTNFSTRYSMLCDGNFTAISDEYERLLLGFGQWRSFVDAGGAFEARITGVEPDGHLLLQRSDGTEKRYAFKELEQPV